MKSIKELESQIHKWRSFESVEPFEDDINLLHEAETKLQTLKEVLELIEKCKRYVWSEKSIIECSKDYSLGLIKFEELKQHITEGERT
ncbi:hypothetical protein LCGC14_0632550 [marine sediment metagenome]|uniref:Uncharacterized protein n=1 Tax=marine sediment metagenome TaxID=412755 RepID=A0A0F9R1E0_9ZZZZ